jgi:hypothetical protein
MQMFVSSRVLTALAPAPEARLRPPAAHPCSSRTALRSPSANSPRARGPYGPTSTAETLLPERRARPSGLCQIQRHPQKPLLSRQPLQFSVLPADIWARFTSNFWEIIRLTSGRRAVVEDKPEVKRPAAFVPPDLHCGLHCAADGQAMGRRQTPRQIAR